MSDPAPRRREFRLSWAIAASVAVHGLLWLVLIVLAPLFDLLATADPLPREESVLQFTFGPPAEQEQANRSGQPLPEGSGISDPAPRPVRLPSPDASPLPPVDDPGVDTRLEQPAPRGVEGSDVVDTLRQPVDPSRPDPEADPVQERSSLADDPRAALRRAPERTGSAGATRGASEPVLDWREKVDSFGRALSERPLRPVSGQSATGAEHEFAFDAPGFEATGYGVGNLTFHSRDYDWSDYARRIYWAILRAWYNRMSRTIDDFEYWAAGNSWELNHADLIRFVIEGNGNVTGVELLYESGCPPMDASAIGALEEVVLPPLPDDFPKEREVVDARFIAWGPIFLVQRKVNICDSQGACRWVPSDTLQGESRMTRIPVMRQHLSRWLANDRGY